MGATTTATVPEVGSLRHVPPGELLLERNIRETRLDPEFLASVRELGVLEPIVAVLNDTGALVVRFGHRRALAAVEAGRDTVPVYVAGSDDLATAAEVDRIIGQHDENTRRSGLTASEQAGVVDQLVAFGIPADQIAKKARIPKERVDAAIKVAGSKAATAAAAKYESITLDHAAVIAEFDGMPEVVKQLTEVAVKHPQDFAHAAQRRRDERDRAEEVEQLRGELQKAGVKIIDDPAWEYRAAKPLDRLLDKPGGKTLNARGHADCPGHVGWVTRHHVPQIAYGCRNASGNGHVDRYSSRASSPKAADMAPAEREKAKAARKLVIENNKAWASATTVRRDWLKVFAKLKTPPKGAAAFIAWAIAEHAQRLDEIAGRELAGGWLGAKVKKIGYTERPDITGLTTGASEARALQIVLVQVLAGFESFAPNNLTWRRNGKTEWHGRYLSFLEEAGYTLSEVEKYAVSSRRPD